MEELAVSQLRCQSIVLHPSSTRYQVSSIVLHQSSIIYYPAPGIKYPVSCYTNPVTCYTIYVLSHNYVPVLHMFEPGNWYTNTIQYNTIDIHTWNGELFWLRSRTILPFSAMSLMLSSYNFHIFQKRSNLTFITLKKVKTPREIKTSWKARISGSGCWLLSWRGDGIQGGFYLIVLICHQYEY